MRWSFISFSFSLFFLVISIGIIAIQGFNWGIDFTGGIMIELNLTEAANLEKIRDGLRNAGFIDSFVQNFGSCHDIILRLPLLEDKCFDQEFKKKILDVIAYSTGCKVTLNRAEFIGPNIGSNLLQDGGIALFIALIAIFIYVWCRFEWRIAIGAVISLLHDIIVTLGVLSLLKIEIDLTIIASLMSVIGYSLNDSIVVSDRIRENFQVINFYSAYDIINISLTQIFNRTIITSTTILVAMVILLIFGGTALRGFSIVLFTGVLIGTISSIYVSSALSLKLGIKRQFFLKEEIEKECADRKWLIP
ncbi:protein translocase subunit SecF [Sodalis sp. CWE]|uniref:protein translocase subunit SecF n=1 Tax=Sodalis sp. CWE TaxID=2803816 RepID=UPI001C7D8641|nr:protein translocase subunit SecF [Sodalis sp. CWE]